MQIVPAVSTPITAEQARVALVAAMPGIDRETGTLLLALVWIETARGHLMNHNAGNITAGPQWPGNAWRPPWFEVTAETALHPHLIELHEKMLHGQAPSAFRAYGSLLEGFQDFGHVLRNQFKSVLEAAKTGDARAFVAALHDSGYSRDYSPAHVPSMTQLQAELGQQFAGFPSAAQVSNAAPSFFANIALDVGIAVMAGLVIASHNEHKRNSRRANRRARREGWLR
jgi:hypothetical protein